MTFLRRRPLPPPEPFDAARWVEVRCERLKKAYNDQTPIYVELFQKAGGRMPGVLFCRVRRGERTIDLAALQRLFRAVHREHEG